MKGRAMKNIALLILISLSTLNAIVAAPAKPDWVPLFNGKDLQGWKNNGDEKWVVEQGAILGESSANKYGYLTTEKTYRDFDLRLKFKGEADGNAGLFLHSKITGLNPEHGPDIVGMQVIGDEDVATRGRDILFAPANRNRPRALNVDKIK